jgi:hypothetical protein
MGCLNLFYLYKIMGFFINFFNLKRGGWGGGGGWALILKV